MATPLLGIRPDDRRDTAVAFGTLVALLAGHALLETARDALFLEKLPAESLPFAYLVIAALALGVTRANQLALRRLPRRKLLSASLGVGALGTAAFWMLLATPTPLGLGALYVWTGLLATVVVVQFWLQLGDRFDVGQAKRLFSIIGAGGLVGATAGAVGASLLLLVAPPRALLLASAGMFAVAAAAPLAFTPIPEAAPTPRRRRVPAPNTAVRAMARDTYLVRLFAMIAITAVLVTGVDYVFKAAVVAHVQQSGGDIGSFFARYYAVINGLSLLVQLAIAPRLLRVLGVNQTLLVLPVLMLVGSVGLVAAAAGLVPALLLKGADGALRHSVVRTGTEILYLPLSTPVRGAFKGLADAVGQRGGQAVASLLILGATSLSATPTHIGIALAVLSGAWIACILGLQPHYLALFKTRLRDGALTDRVGAPDLDLRSFEALLAALSADEDAEVIAALDLFAAYGKIDLVPALILYHPSTPVVLRAFALFGTSDRTDVVRLTERLLGHADPAIRSAALRASRDPAVLRTHLTDPSAAVQCTALTLLVAAGELGTDEATERLRAMLDDGQVATRLAVAAGLGALPAQPFAWLAAELAASEPAVACAMCRSLAAHPNAATLEVLVALLANREVRADARGALVALGPPARERLARILADPDLDRRIRRHLPRTLSRFGGPAVLDVLLNQLAVEPDEAVAFKILRGAGRMREDDPDLPIDRHQILRLADKTLKRAVVMLDRRLGIEAAVASGAVGGRTVELLQAWLSEAEDRAMERTFRLLHILEPGEDFRILFAGLRSPDRSKRASSREVLSVVVPQPLDDGLLALADDLPDRARLTNATASHPPEHPTDLDAIGAIGQPRPAAREAYVALLRAMLQDASTALRSIVGYHVAELHIGELRAITATGD